jgi:SAM-dependent methyltransferase
MMPSFPSEPVRGRRCPSCGGSDLTAFYEVRDIPVHSNVLMPTRTEALACPTGDLRLAFCRHCAFITNTAFEPATQEVTAKYEATQGFSPTYNTFTRSLARQWAERYSLAGKHALEIGCGPGEFISLLCEVGGCHGIGIDPLADPARLPSAAAGRVRLIADYYSQAYADLPADFICCRHTLEHIHHPAAFVRMIRDVIGARADAVVAFEVPDTLRVLAEGAFWDLYYEHCSYFTPGSLALLFRNNRFALLDLRSEYDGQYLVLEAAPAPAPTRSDPAEVDYPLVHGAWQLFRDTCRARLEKWRRVLSDAASAGRRVAVWGSGSKAVGFLASMGVKDNAVPYVVDINPHKHGTYLPGGGQQIVAPETLQDYRADVVIAMNPVYREEIASDLRRLGVGAELLTL